MNSEDKEKYVQKVLQYYRKECSNGWYVYILTQTFKDGTDYEKLNPRKAHELFKERFKKYMSKHEEYKMSMYPEIGKTGRFHYHGIIAFKRDAKEYTKFDAEVRTTRNYLNRMYGRHTMQRVYDLNIEYETDDIKNYVKYRTLKTTFEKCVRYITKDVGLFAFLKSIEH